MPLPNFGSSNYNPPGVYWDETTTPASAIGSAAGPLAAIVGPGIGYRIGNLDSSVTLTGTSTVPLSALGINLSSVTVTSTDGTTTYANNTDYVLVQTASTDGNPVDTTTTIARPSSGSGISSGQTVTVTYQYADASYFTPTLVTNFQQVVNLYGAPYNTTTAAILSPLSLAAQIAFTNGANQLVLCASAGSASSVTRTQLSTALSLLASRNDVTIVCELPVGLTGTSGSPGDIENVINDFALYLYTQETTNDILQLGIIGYETTVANGASGALGADIIANSVSVPVSTGGYKRVVESWPNQLLFYSGYTNTTQVVAGYYLAAAYAGILAANPPQQGLTRMAVKGFAGISPLILNYMTPAFKNNLSSNGVAVTEITQSGVMQVRQGVTTDASSIFNKEISLVRIQDAMISSLIGTVEDSSIIGGPITANTVAAVNGMVTTTLDSLVTSGDITSYQGVTVVVNSLVPTEIDVTFAYLPVYPLNYVTISFSIDASGA